VTAVARAPLEALYGAEAVLDVEPLTTPGRSSSFSEVALARVCGAGGTDRVVVRTGAPAGPFQKPEDAARQLLWYARVSGLARHPRVLATMMADEQGCWHRLSGDPRVTVVEEYMDGVPYADDLARIRDGGPVIGRDERRARALARYLAGIHRERRTDDAAYLRGLRELVGGPEGVMSVIALYPAESRLRHRKALDRLQAAVMERVLELQYRTRPVAEVHGDFHPGNILFAGEEDFRVIDRGRLEYDEPAVDVGALLVNYLAIDLAGDAAGSSGRALARTFLAEYLAASGDRDIVAALPVHTAMRVAAVASPAFYPDLGEHSRAAILAAGAALLRRPVLTPDDLDRGPE
jgi:hypothetical protein